MYNLAELGGDGYYAIGGGDSLLDKAVEYIKANAKVVLAVIIVLFILVLALYFNYLRPYGKEGLISGSMASWGIGGGRRSDWGSADDMVLKLNYGSPEGFVSDESVAARAARDLSVTSANQAFAVVPGQPCDKPILTDDDGYSWMLAQAQAPAPPVTSESYAQPSDAKLTASMKGY